MRGGAARCDNEAMAVNDVHGEGVGKSAWWWRLTVRVVKVVSDVLVVVVVVNAYRILKSPLRSPQLSSPPIHSLISMSNQRLFCLNTTNCHHHLSHRILDTVTKPNLTSHTPFCLLRTAHKRALTAG